MMNPPHDVHLETILFSLAFDYAKLMKNTKGFQEDAYSTRIDTFLREKGCIEDGHASERVADLITSLMPGGPV